MADDAELLRRYAETHSEPAFTEFVGRHINLVYFTALRVTGGDTALAQDVAQAVFVVAARRARALISHATVAGWLHTTTRHIAAREARKQRTRQRYEHQSAMHQMITGGSEHDWARLQPVIDDALGELDARDRQAILERFFEGRAFGDLGAAWRISADAARMRVDRALDKLRVALERRGIASVASALAAVLAAQGSLAAPASVVAAVSSGAFAATAAAGGAATLFSIMTASKTILGAAAVLVVLATGTAVFKHREAKLAEGRLETANRELAALRTQIARAEQQRSAAETVAAEAEKDSGELLAAVEAARTKASASGRTALASGGKQASSPDDLLAQSLQPMFPNGIVGMIGDRAITVDDVRRQITPLLPKLQQTSANPAELRQRLYALQNGVIADLVTRQLNVREFHNPADADPSKHVAAQMVDTAFADRVKEQFGNDQAAFLAYLNSQGVTLAQYRQTVEEDIIYSYMRGQQRRLAPAKGHP